METLSHIFGSAARVKIMRFFLFHEGEAFDAAEISQKSMVARATATKELTNLHKIGFLKKQKFTRVTYKELKSGTKELKRSGMGFTVSTAFPLLKALRELLINSELIQTKEVINRLQGAGSLKLLVLCGIFLHQPRKTIDLLVVGDRLDMTKIPKLIADIEAEIGTEVRYSIFTTEEFRYRLDMYDKLLRDVFDYHHKIVLDKLKLDY